MIDCVLCGTEFPDWQDLAEHLCRKHAGFSIGADFPGSRWKPQITNGPLGCSCFCGWMSEKREKVCEFAQHLKTSGGLAAHILAVKMGIDE